MAKNLYIASLEPNSGRVVVSAGRGGSDHPW